MRIRSPGYIAIRMEEREIRACVPKCLAGCARPVLDMDFLQDFTLELV
jgi:hypothetical protein